MIHNGVEYGMMQAFGEGFDIMANSNYKLDLNKVAKLWTKGTIVSGFLADRLSEMFEKDQNLESFKGQIARSGEGDWTIEAARKAGVGIEVIDDSVAYRQKSETDEKIQNSMTARVINALRHAFGGHEIKK
jgi:6-phosphogluconate dehydrogenase